MPIEFGIWRIDGKPIQVTPSSLEDESKLEKILVNDISILGLDVMVIGRQVVTAYNKKIDVLTINSQGHLCGIELKRDRTPREVISQLLDYGSWIQTLTYEDIVSIFSKDFPAQQFEQVFAERFGEVPEVLNEDQQLIVVASELDNSTERIVSYLSQYGVPINAVFFRYLKDGSREYLVRAWLIDPNTAEARADSSSPKKSGKQEPWNGQDFYVSLGEGQSRTWDDCVKYGFISGGGGLWYSRTLASLFPDARVFVNIPGKGYVGVGIVTERSQRVKDFTVEIDGKIVPILQVPLHASKMGENADDPEKAEYLVRVKWLKIRSREEAVWEKGMFAKQHTACKLRNKFTIDRLVELFGITEE